MDPLLDIAARYGVKVVNGRPNDLHGFGPTGDDCDAFTRTVYRNRGRPDLSTDSGCRAFAYTFHELTHVLCAIPFVGYGDGVEQIDEAFVLLPFEERFAAAVAPAVTHAAIRSYQGCTQVDSCSHEWGNHPIIGLLRRSGLARARKVGLLDQQNEPTFRWPDWSKLGLRTARGI